MTGTANAILESANPVDANIGANTKEARKNDLMAFAKRGMLMEYTKSEDAPEAVVRWIFEGLETEGRAPEAHERKFSLCKKCLLVGHPSMKICNVCDGPRFIASGEGDGQTALIHYNFTLRVHPDGPICELKSD